MTGWRGRGFPGEIRRSERGGGGSEWVGLQMNEWMDPDDDDGVFSLPTDLWGEREVRSSFCSLTSLFQVSSLFACSLWLVLYYLMRSMCPLTFRCSSILLLSFPDDDERRSLGMIRRKEMRHEILQHFPTDFSSGIPEKSPDDSHLACLAKCTACFSCCSLFRLHSPPPPPPPPPHMICRHWLSDQPVCHAWWNKQRSDTPTDDGNGYLIYEPKTYTHLLLLLALSLRWSRHVDEKRTVQSQPRK